MTLAQILQFYGPLAGLLGVVFWLGMLTQQVKDLKEDIDELKGNAEAGGSAHRLTTLEVQMKHVEEGVTSIKRSLDGIQRQLGNLMRPQGAIQEFGREA